MAEVSRSIEAQPLTSAAWSPFGWLPVADTDADDGTHRLEFEWGDPHLNVISHFPSEITRGPEGLRCDRLYRHDTHTQALLALNGPSVIVVAPRSADFSTEDDLACARGFRLEPLDAFVLDKGTWHWGPFPLTDAPVRLYNVQGLGYRDDNASVDLAARGMLLAVRTA